MTRLEIINQRPDPVFCFCPITNKNRNIPFHIEIPEKSSLTGFIMVEQVKSIDCRSRKVKFIEKADKEILNEALSVLDACIYQNT